MRGILFIAFLFVVLIGNIIAGEVDETKRLASKYKAKTEVTLWDRTRVDMVNDTYAIEVDWAPKWAEAIGQSLYYAEVTKLKPAIILLVKNKTTESRYIYRAQTVAAKYDIQLYIEEVKK